MSVDSRRLHELNTRSRPQKAQSILYVMSRDQRTDDNYALLAAQAASNEQNLPLVVAFIAYQKSGQRAREQFSFMYDGLQEVADSLEAKQIPFVIRSGASARVEINRVVAELLPAAVYFDFSPLRGPQKLHHALATELAIPCIEVDTHNVVPIWVASDKQEFAARTIRPKIHKQLGDFLEEPPRLQIQSLHFADDIESLTIAELRSRILPQLPANGTIPDMQSGQKAAQNALADFLDERLAGYATKRNDPANNHLSELSPYLHYGQLSAQRVALEVQKTAEEQHHLAEDAAALIEELVVRKELSDNFCYYNSHYDSLEGAPAWAQKTLRAHQDDPRPHVYSYKQLEDANTEDPAWNAAQIQLRQTGKIHGYMRMYWAKKVLEWSESPQQALETLISLNDFYHIDGGDPNGYVGILWSVAGLHDRPWREREIFGQVRYMNAAGLRRKFAIDQYIAQFSRLTMIG